jgi:hypothetical protein
MRDFEALNRLVKGEESSDRWIAFAVLDALDDWNTTPPLLYHDSIESHPSTHLLILGTIISLLESVTILNMRNYLVYNDGGGTTSTSTGNVQLYERMLARMRAMYEQKKARFRTALNVQRAIAGGPGGVHSEYHWVHGYFRGLGVQTYQGDQR